MACGIRNVWSAAHKASGAANGGAFACTFKLARPGLQPTSRTRKAQCQPKPYQVKKRPPGAWSVQSQQGWLQEDIKQRGAQSTAEGAALTDVFYVVAGFSTIKCEVQCPQRVASIGIVDKQ